MGNFNVGLFLKGVREAAGFTQESLSEGLCEVSTLSRIETGSQMPSLGLVIDLFDRLDVSGFSLAQQFFDGRETDVAQIQRDLIRHLSESNLDRVEEYLLSMKAISSMGEPRVSQLYEFCQLGWQGYSMNKMGKPLDEVAWRCKVRSRLIEILHITDSKATLDQLQKGNVYWTKKHLAHSEFMVWNAIALVEYSYGQRQIAIRILTGLVNLSMEEPKQDDMARRRTSTLLMNLAALEIEMGLYEAAFISMQKINGLLYTCGGTQHLIRYHMLLQVLYQRNRQQEEYYENHCMLQALIRKLPKTKKESFYGGRFLYLAPDALFF